MTTSTSASLGQFAHVEKRLLAVQRTLAQAGDLLPDRYQCYIEQWQCEIETVRTELALLRNAYLLFEQSLVIAREIARGDMAYNVRSGNLECTRCTLLWYDVMHPPEAYEHDKDCPIRQSQELLEKLAGMHGEQQGAGQ